MYMYIRGCNHSLVGDYGSEDKHKYDINIKVPEGNWNAMGDHSLV